MAAETTDASDTRDNNFGFLRLLFATLVIVSHSPELVDGNRNREILTQIFGTISLGEAAVDGFFLLSGYLVTKSFLKTESLASYLMKRIARIFPGYLVSFSICVFVIAPFVGAESSILSVRAISHQVLSMLRLMLPDVPGAFHDLPYPLLNGSMWTIAYEFRCYLAAALLGALGVYQPRFRVLLLAVVASSFILHATGVMANAHMTGNSIIGSPQIALRFFAVFGVGSIYYVFRDRVKFTTEGAITAGLILTALLFNKALADYAFVILGGYLIFWFAFKCPVLSLSRADNKFDISYGLYLYAWPIQNIIIWNNRTINPWILCCVSFVCACFAGYASWTLVEKPSMKFLRAKHSSPLPPLLANASKKQSD